MKVVITERQLELIKNKITEQRDDFAQVKDVKVKDQVDSGVRKPDLSNMKPLSKDWGFILFFIFPSYRPEQDDTLVNRTLSYITGGGAEKTKNNKIKYGPLGHGGCIVVTNDGDAKLYEFAPYRRKDIGNVEIVNLGKIAQIKGWDLLNAENVAKIAKSKTQHNGPALKMEVAVHRMNDAVRANNFATSVGSHKYNPVDFSEDKESYNCVTFALEVGLAGGAKVKRGYYTPLPVDLFRNNFKPNSYKIFTV